MGETVRKKIDTIPDTPPPDEVETLAPKGAAEIKITEETRAAEQKLLVQSTLDLVNETPKSIDLPPLEKLKSGEEITAIDIKEAVKGLFRGELKMIGKLISIFYSFFSRKANRVEGLGLKLIDLAEKNPVKARVVAQLRKINQPEDWENKVGTSNALFLHELSLHHAGYRERSAKTSLAISVSAGQKIKDLVNPSVWKQIKNGDVLNALDFENPLPGSADTKYYLHLDSKGFPIYLSDKEGGNHEALLFEKTEDKDELAKMKGASSFEFLTSKLEKGDIIWSYDKNGYAASPLARASGTDASLPFTHVIVYLGRNSKTGIEEVGHIDYKSGGGEIFALSELPSRGYTSLCLGEVAGEDKVVFAENARNWIEATTDYDEWLYVSAGRRLITGKKPKQRPLKKGDSAICYDVFRGSNNKELVALVENGEIRPQKLFELGLMKAKYSAQPRV